MKVEKDIIEFLQDKLFYHNSYLPPKPKDWETYNRIIINDILTFLNPQKQKKENLKKLKEDIKKLRDNGETFEFIARKYGTSRQRIHQIFNKN